MHVHERICTLHICTNVYMLQIHTHVHTHTHMHRHTRSHLCMHTHTHITHTRTHIHTHTNASLGELLSYSPSCIAEAIPLSVDRIKDSALLLRAWPLVIAEHITEITLVTQ